MPPAETGVSLLRFGVFELDCKNNELRKAGVLVKLPREPMEVLRLLAENTGELLEREQIQQEIWGKETFVDFDRNLNVCMAQIRAALNDDPDSPRFIQTVPRRGYRFLAPVERLHPPEPVPAEPPRPPQPGRRGRYLWVAGFAACVMLAAGYLAWRRSSQTAPVPSQRVLLASLPFENLGGGAEEEFFIDGLLEELIGQLGSLHPDRLGVIARTSVMRYKGAPRGIDEVGRALGVDFVIEGTVRRNGGRMRLTARLIKVADQAQVWAETYGEPLTGSLDTQQQAAARIAGGVATHLFPVAPPSQVRFPLVSREAYEPYRKARYLQHKGNRDDLERSLPHFEQAIALHPAFAEAYAGLADACVYLARSGSPKEEAFPGARSAARRALDLDESNPEAQNALANVLFWYDWSWSEAERRFRRAIEINPSFSAAHHDYAWFLVTMGRTEDGLASLRRAISLDPLSARVNIDAGWLLLQAHRFEEAEKQARRTLDLEPSLGEARACLARSLVYQGNYRSALEEATRALPLLRAELSGLDPESAIRRLYRSRLEQAEKGAGERDTHTMAMRYAFLGEKAKALDELERGYEARSMMMPLLKTDPAFTWLHGEPRFQQLVRKVGIP